MSAAKAEKKESNEYKRLGGASQFDGERITMDDVLTKDIVVDKLVVQPSQFKDDEGNIKNCIIMQIKLAGTSEPRVLISGATTIINAVSPLVEKLPVTVKIERGKSAKGRKIYEVFLKEK